MKKRIFAAAVCAAAVLSFTGCNESGDNAPATSTTSSSTTSSTANATSTSTTSSTVSSSTSSAASTTSGTSASTTTSADSTSEASTSGTSSTSSSSSTSSKPVEETWTESTFTAPETWYVKQDGIYSRVKPIRGSNTVKKYKLNDKVTIVGKTDTDYFKLEDGSYIHKDYLATREISITSSSSTSSSKPPAQNPNSHIDDKIYTDHGIEQGIPITKPIPTNLNESQLEYIYDQLNNGNVYRELWNLNIGDVTSNGNTIIGKTPEGFGYIGLPETDKDKEWGIYLGDIKNGEKYYIYDVKMRDKKWSEVWV